LFNGPFLTHDAFTQTELPEGAFEILPLSFDLEVAVAFEMVGIEAQAQFERNQPNRGI